MVHQGQQGAQPRQAAVDADGVLIGDGVGRSGNPPRGGRVAGLSLDDSQDFRIASVATHLPDAGGGPVGLPEEVQDEGDIEQDSVGVFRFAAAQGFGAGAGEIVEGLAESAAGGRGEAQIVEGGTEVLMGESPLALHLQPGLVALAKGNLKQDAVETRAVASRGNGGLSHPLGVAVSAGPLVGSGQHLRGVGRRGIQKHRAFSGADRLRVLAQLSVHVAQVAPVLGNAGIDLIETRHAADSLLQVADSAAIVEHLDGEPLALGGRLAKVEGLLVVGRGMGRIVAVVVRSAEEAVGAGEVGVDADGAFEQALSGFEIAALQAVRGLAVGAQRFERGGGGARDGRLEPFAGSAGFAQFPAHAAGRGVQRFQNPFLGSHLSLVPPQPLPAHTAFRVQQQQIAGPES